MTDLRELLAAATPGPWRVRVNPGDNAEDCDLNICGDIFQLAHINGPQYAHQHANARLIVEAVNALPALLADQDAMRERIAALEGALNELAARQTDPAELRARLEVKKPPPKRGKGVGGKGGPKPGPNG